MAYCKKCGKKVDDETKFCPNCGTLIERDELEVSVESENDADDAETRRQVYVGLIRKCPSCGAELSSNAAVCPQCGFELNTRKGAQALQEFSQELNAIEDKIAAEGTKSKGWSTWGTWAKIGWVLLNIYTFCLPIIIPSILRQIRVLTINPSPKLTAMEERKAKTIENYIVPNEKGAIIESLRFIRTKVEALNKQSKSEKLMYWMNLWAVKAGQINSIASGSLQGDQDVEHQYKGILKITSGTNRSMRVSAGIKLAVLLLVIIIPVSSITSILKTGTKSSSKQTTSEDVSEDVPAVNKANRVANGYNEQKIGGLLINVPDYYGDNEAEDGSGSFFAETGNGVVYLDITPYDISADNESFLIGYDAVLDNFFKGLGNSDSGKDLRRSNKQTKFKTDSGLMGVLEEFTYTMTMDEEDIPINGCIALVNNPDSENIVGVGLLQSQKSQYNYFPEYAEMLKKIKTSTD